MSQLPSLGKAAGSGTVQGLYNIKGKGMLFVVMLPRSLFIIEKRYKGLISLGYGISPVI